MAKAPSVDELINLGKLITKQNEKISHESICKELNNIYKAKNADYGNSFSESYQEWGIISAVVRMDDKMRRLKQLVKHDRQVKAESMEDTLLDMANYAIMTLQELRRGNNSID
jgi:Nucleotide modification associated domain 1